jgi:hypothetical protein
MKFIHKQNEKTYHVILRDVKVKINGKWVDAVMYTREVDAGNETLFVRAKGEFSKKFEKA